MGKKLKKYRVAIVFEVETDQTMKTVWALTGGKIQEIYSEAKFETLDVEELDYPDIKLEEI